MADSGIKPSQEIEDIIQALQKKQYQYAVFELAQIKDPNAKAGKKTYGWSIVTTGDRLPGVKTHDRVPSDVVKPAYEKFCDDYLDPKSALYALYDFSVLQPEGSDAKNYKIGGIQWCPDTLPCALKMTYSTSLKGIKGKADSSITAIANKDRDELAFDKVIELLQGN